MMVQGSVLGDVSDVFEGSGGRLPLLRLSNEARRQAVNLTCLIEIVRFTTKVFSSISTQEGK